MEVEAAKPTVAVGFCCGWLVVSLSETYAGGDRARC